MRAIYHITTREAWDDAAKRGQYVAESLATDGFIHCSTKGQVTETANGFFRGRRGLVLLCINESLLKTPLKYEPPAGGVVHDPSVGPLFPHLYGPLNLEAVIRVADFPPSPDGTFRLPQASESQ